MVQIHSNIFYSWFEKRIEFINNYRETGKNLARVYLDLIKEWKFDISKQQPLQTIKSFIIILTGCETAQ